MKCLDCGTELEYVESAAGLIRRYSCPNCGYFERIDDIPYWGTQEKQEEGSG